MEERIPLAGKTKGILGGTHSKDYSLLGSILGLRV